MLRIKNYLYRKKAYWIIKKWLDDKPIFTFWSQIYSADFNLGKSKDSARLLWPTLWPFARVVAYSAFIVAILETYNYVWPVNSQSLSSGAIDSLLIAIASVSGVFLGLYFTAISGIASNFLLRATQNIRRHFLSTPAGEQYVQTVALTGIVSVFYLTVKSFGHSIHPVSLIFLSILGAYIIIRFWRVGSGVFYSLEPTSYLPYITKDVISYINSVTPPGYKWNKPTLQNHNRRLAVNSLELIDNLNDFGIREIKLSDEQQNIALNYLSGLLFVYSENKRRIPTNSVWYKTRNEFESWTLASSISISIALQTGTTLAPKAIKDFTWFEEQTLDIALNILKRFAEDKKIGSTYEGLEAFVNIAEIYSKNLDEAAIKLLFEKLDTITPIIYAIKTDGESNQANKEHLAFIDAQGRLAIAAALGLTKHADGKSIKGLLEKISTIKWASSQGIYNAGMPFAIISNLESLALNLKNEIIVEGKLHSPAWYIETLCFHSYLFALQKYFAFIKSLHSEYFQSKFDELITAEQLPLAVHLLQRWIEFNEKYESLIFTLKKHVEECRPFHRIKDLSWPVFDFASEERTALERKKEVVDKLIQLLPKLNDLTIGKDLPDYFGQALTLGIEACYEACKENDEARLKKILPSVFTASLAAFDKVREKVKDWAQEDSKIIYSTEPLINLFEISGYVRLYSELYQNQKLWDIAQTIWDAYLGAVDARKFIEFVAAMVSYRDGLFMIMPQGILRTSWSMSFEHKVREHGFPMFPDRESYEFVNDRRQPNHPSALIRVIVRWGSLSYKASDIFFVNYLFKHAAASDIDLPGTRHLREDLEREQQEVNINQTDE